MKTRTIGLIASLLLLPSFVLAKNFQCRGTRSIGIEFQLQLSNNRSYLEFVRPPSNIGSGIHIGDTVNLENLSSSESCNWFEGERRDGVTAKICIPNRVSGGYFTTNAVFIFPNSDFGSTTELGYEVECQE